MNIREEAEKLKKASPYMAATSVEVRNNVLLAIAKKLKENAELIFAENKKDLAAAESAGITPAVMKRLKFNESKLEDVCAGIAQLVTLPDPIGRCTLKRELDEGLVLQRVTCPIGVIGVIFEARPDALVQISSLCIKSGNCAILKGGKETVNTNRILFRLIKETAVENGLPENCMVQAELHNEISELLSCNKYVDLLIPRGSNAFVQYIMNNTKIPVMGHADGICHIYVDKTYDIGKALNVITDAKTQYTAACNATETLLVHRNAAETLLPKLAVQLKSAGVKIRGTKEVNDLLKDIYESNSGKAADGALNCAETMALCDEVITDDVFPEYLDLIISVKLVDDIYEAIDHINTRGSHHTDCIITEDNEAAEIFMQLVDSAGVYKNCSTRFADGFRYGFGAEVGISTSKIHARGPVGLEGLVTYKYKLYGEGQIVGDYASGKKQFHHKDLEI